jgi:electron transfer flavoprotein alpha/beta subunit
VIMAELLGLPHATIVIEVDARATSCASSASWRAAGISGTRCRLPALLTIQSGISQIRYATLKGIMAAKKKEIKEVTPSAEIVGVLRISDRKDLSAAEDEADAMLGNGDAKGGRG